jgi:hypothetical protein
MTHHDDPAFRRFILSAVPSLTGCRTAQRTWIDLFIFGLAVLAGTWTVHQIEYAIVYGHRFGAVMATTPHRYYMGTLGVLLASGALLAGMGALCVVGLGHVRGQRVRRRLPARYGPFLASPLPIVPLSSMGVTAALLISLQTGLYLLQENLEALTAFNTLPGLGVLLAPQHLTVMPLHALVGSFLSLVLWTVSSWLHRTRQTGRLARVLAALFHVPPARATRPTAGRVYLPGLRFRSGSLGLRAPPTPDVNFTVFPPPAALARAA